MLDLLYTATRSLVVGLAVVVVLLVVFIIVVVVVVCRHCQI